MAVFTPVPEADIARWLDERFRVGRLVRAEPIAQGVENTNYFVDTQSGRFVLTLVERVPAGSMPFFVGLMKHLARHGIRCPEPVEALDGSLWGRLNGKPATLVTRLAGQQHLHPTVADCMAVGELLAAMHLAAADFTRVAPPNPRGLRWWADAAHELAPVLSAGDSALMRDELGVQQRFADAQPTDLPRSAVHADLFRDNVLFDDGGAPGAIDFWFACSDWWVFDLAVTCNDWCLRETASSDEPGSGEEASGKSDGGHGDAAKGDAVKGVLDQQRFEALVTGYTRRRELTLAEHQAWPTMLRAAAFRFWMSRLHDVHLPRDASLLAPKDPDIFRRILEAHRTFAPALDFSAADFSRDSRCR